MECEGEKRNLTPLAVSGYVNARMSVLGSHPHLLHQITPSVTYVMKYVDQTSDRGLHWFWRDDRSYRRHNAAGQALLAWRVKATAASGYQEHGLFNVARLLIAHRDGPIPPRTRFILLCGLPQCVNPAHWGRVLPSVPWRITVLEHGYWRLVRRRTGVVAPPQVYVFSVVHQEEVHLVEITQTKDALFMQDPRSACGKILSVLDSVLTTAPVTCQGCR